VTAATVVQGLRDACREATNEINLLLLEIERLTKTGQSKPGRVPPADSLGPDCLPLDDCVRTMGSAPGGRGRCDGSASGLDPEADRKSVTSTRCRDTGGQPFDSAPATSSGSAPAADGTDWPTSGAGPARKGSVESRETVACPYVTGTVTRYCTLTPFTITDKEREAIKEAIWGYSQNDDDDECASIAATLRSLLARMPSPARNAP
jgi:hypothetical protein